MLKKKTKKQIKKPATKASANGKIKDPIGYMKSKNRTKRKPYTTFLRGLLHRKVRGIDGVAKFLNDKAFEKINCLDCANCCKTMSPTYTKADIKRISKHLGMTSQQYHDKYLEKDVSGDFMNKSVPCQFLKKDNKCGIYSVRPRDCSGFPHTQYRDFKLYISSTHIQNISYCPITLNVVEKMHELVIEKKMKNITVRDCK